MTNYANIKGHEYAACHVRTEGNNATLISYVTEVVKVTYKGGKRFIECTGLYSRTTIKHIGWFVREYLPDLTYYDIKAIAGCGCVAL